MSDPKVTIDGHEFDAGHFTINFAADPVSPYGDLGLKPLSYLGDVKIGSTLTLDVDATTYERLLSLRTAPVCTFEMTRERGEPDPFFERPTSWRGVLRQMWRILSYDFRRAAGMVEPHVRETVTIPNLRWRSSGGGVRLPGLVADLAGAAIVNLYLVEGPWWRAGRAR